MSAFWIKSLFLTSIPCLPDYWLSCSQQADLGFGNITWLNFFCFSPLGKGSPLPLTWTKVECFCAQISPFLGIELASIDEERGQERYLGLFLPAEAPWVRHLTSWALQASSWHECEDAASALLSWRMSCKISQVDGMALWQTKWSVVFPSVTTCLISFYRGSALFVKSSFSLPLCLVILLIISSSCFQCWLSTECPWTSPSSSDISSESFPQELTGFHFGPAMMRWFNSHIPTANPHGGDGTFQLIPFLSWCHYTLPLIRSDSTPHTSIEEITMLLSLES